MPGIDPRALLRRARQVRGRAGRCADVRVGWCRPRVARAAGFRASHNKYKAQARCGLFCAVSQYKAWWTDPKQHARFHPIRSTVFKRPALADSSRRIGPLSSAILSYPQQSQRNLARSTYPAIPAIRAIRAIQRDSDPKIFAAARAIYRVSDTHPPQPGFSSFGRSQCIF